MCPFEISGTKRGSVKDSYIALILMAPLTQPLPSLAPRSYRVNPDLPQPPKRRGPASGSPGRDLRSGSNELKTALPCPSKDLRGPALGDLGVFKR